MGIETPAYAHSLHQTWFRPGGLFPGIGDDTYRINVCPGQFNEQHEIQLCVCEPDLHWRHVSLNYTAHEGDSDEDYAEQEDYSIEKIQAQHQSAQARAGVDFKVRWKGYWPSHDTWGQVFSFVPWINTPFMEYVRRHKTKMQVSHFEALNRAIEATGS